MTSTIDIIYVSGQLDKALVLMQNIEFIAIVMLIGIGTCLGAICIKTFMERLR